MGFLWVTGFFVFPLCGFSLSLFSNTPAHALLSSVLSQTKNSVINAWCIVSTLGYNTFSWHQVQIMITKGAQLRRLNLTGTAHV